jgi:hypothetical protein
MVRNEIENQVVASSAPGEILLRMINDPIGPEGSDHFHISGTAHAGHVCAERLGDLHGERSYAPGGAVDQDVLPRLHVPLIAKTLQGGEGRDWYRRRFLKRHVGWLHAFMLRRRVLRRPGFATSEH